MMDNYLPYGNHLFHYNWAKNVPHKIDKITLSTRCLEFLLDQDVSTKHGYIPGIVCGHSGDFDLKIVPLTRKIFL